MIERVTRLLLLIQAGIVAALAWLFHNKDLGWLAAIAGSLAIVIAFRMLLTAANFLLSLYYRAPVPAHARLGLAGVLRLFLEEFAASGITSSWSMPFRAFRTRAVPQPAALPVLLVHGYACNSGYWESMSDALTLAGISHHACDLEPVGGSIDGYAAPIHAALARLMEEHGTTQAIIVAHSMGGVATRAYIRAHGSGLLAGVVTLGSPHHGTGLARFGPGLNSHQMRWHGRAGQGEPGRWLRELAASEDAALRALFVSIWSRHDNIVSPPDSAVLPDARDIAFHGIGHVALARHAGIQRAVVQEVLQISAKASRG